MCQGRTVAGVSASANGAKSRNKARRVESLLLMGGGVSHSGTEEKEKETRVYGKCALYVEFHMQLVSSIVVVDKRGYKCKALIIVHEKCQEVRAAAILSCSSRSKLRDGIVS